MGFLVACSSGLLQDRVQAPLIKKIGTIDCDLVETTPIVFKNKLYRFEYIRINYELNTTGDTYFRFVDPGSGEINPAFAKSWHLGSAFVQEDSVFVTAVNGWGGNQIAIFSSGDLIQWNQRLALNLPANTVYNTSICKNDSLFVLMYEIGDPPEEAGVRFTARFATSPDLKTWTVTPKECNFDKSRYTAPHALRYLDGYYYNFYLKAKPNGSYETYVVRSKDLIFWKSSPANPVLEASDSDKIPSATGLTAAQKQKISTAKNINNSDIDFCEFEGRVIINYSWGDQNGHEFLAEAVFEGSLESFLRGWFEVLPDK
jgi:hypothetical protein